MRQERARGTSVARAFSLLELTVVLIIMGIAGAMAAPRYAGFIAKSHLDAAASRITVDLELARRTAKRTGTSRSVVFNTALDSYSITERSGMDRKSIAYSVALSENPYMAQIVSVTFSGGSITFDGFGVPDSSGSVVIQVGRYQRQINVTAGTGSGIIKLVPGTGVQ